MMRVPLTVAETEEAAGWVCRIGEVVEELMRIGHAAGDGTALTLGIAMALDVLADDLDAILGGGSPVSRRGTAEEDAQKLAAVIWVRLRVRLEPNQSLRPLYSAVRVLHDEALIRCCASRPVGARRLWPSSPEA